LVSIYGGTTLEGRPVPGNPWIYEFAEESLPVRPYVWYAYPSGQILFHGPIVEPLRLALVDISPGLFVDSDQAVRLARDYGAQAYIDRYPNAQVDIRCLRTAQVPTWTVHFSTIPLGNPFCEVSIDLNAQTGALLNRDVGCLG
jgi:hypothetical protein